jgi:hypothetical protein
MKNLDYYLQYVVNLLLAVLYIFGGLALLIPNTSQIVDSIGYKMPLGIALLAFAFFGSPFCQMFVKEPEESLIMPEDNKA